MPITPPLIDIVDSETFNDWSQQTTDELNEARETISNLQDRATALEATIVLLTARIVALEPTP